MGRLMSVAIAGMFTVFLLTIFSEAIYDASDDSSKVNFTRYQEMEDFNATLDNVTYQNTNDSVSNFQMIGNSIRQSIEEAQTGLESGDISEMLGASFGLISSLTLNVLYLLLSVISETVNLIAGVGENLEVFPDEWAILGRLTSFAIALGIVFIVFLLVATIMKWNV